jgi:hypothetical protein
MGHVGERVFPFAEAVAGAVCFKDSPGMRYYTTEHERNGLGQRVGMVGDAGSANGRQSVHVPTHHTQVEGEPN